MSLNYDDLQAIRKIVQDVVEPLAGEIEAIRNDIKEIYDMLAEQQKDINGSSKFQKLDLEKKILKIHSELVIAAKQAGVTLPR